MSNLFPLKPGALPVRSLRALPRVGGLFLLGCLWAIGGNTPAQATTTVDPSVTALDNLFKRLKPGQKTVYVGDMGFKVSTLKTWRDHLAGKNRSISGVFNWGDNLTWTNRRIPYVFDSNMAQSYRDQVTSAIFEWQKVANITWVPALPNDADRVRFFFNGSKGMDSFVGRTGQGEQIINIDTSANLIRCAHELGHCQGMVHEQCRDDRDTYVSITSTSGANNALTEINWAKLPAAKSKRYGNYDYDSLMHYPQNGSVTESDGKTYSATITPLEPYYSNAGNPLLGQESHISVLDQFAMSQEYGAPCNISGRVTAPDGTGIAGLTVTCVPTGNSMYFGPPVTTDADGKYLLPGTSTGTYSVAISGSVAPMASSVSISTASATANFAVTSPSYTYTGNSATGYNDKNECVQIPGNNSFDDPKNWGTACGTGTVPGPGDTAVINGFSVTGTNINVGTLIVNGILSADSITTENLAVSGTYAHGGAYFDAGVYGKGGTGSTLRVNHSFNWQGGTLGGE